MWSIVRIPKAAIKAKNVSIDKSNKDKVNEQYYSNFMAKPKCSINSIKYFGNYSRSSSSSSNQEYKYAKPLKSFNCLNK